MTRLFKIGITAEGDITSTGVLKSTQSSGDEGGQIDLTKAVTNTTLITGISIDVFQNKLRIFETGGNNRGYYIDITGGGNSVGTDLVGSGSYSLPTASSTILGGVKLFDDTVQSTTANAVSSTASRTYGAQLNSSNQLVVNVPWTDTVYSLPTATSTTLGGTKLYSDTTQSVAATAVTATASRTYGIQLNSSGQAVVNVPWTDNDTTYTFASGSTNGAFTYTPAGGSATSVSIFGLGSAAYTASTAYISSTLMTTLGDVIYGGASGAAARLAAPTTNGTYVLTSVPSASVGVAPAWALASGLTVSSATSATNATNIAVTNDAATASAVYLTWVGANTGNNAVKTTSTALSFVPSTGTLTATAFSGSGASLTSLNASNIGSGTVPIGNIPTGTSGTTVALGNHTHSYLSLSGGALTGAVTFSDATPSVEGRLIASSGVFYVQAGTDASDTSAVLTVARTLTTSTAISAFNVYATTSAFTGNVTTTGTINQQYTDWTYLLANFR